MSMQTGEIILKDNQATYADLLIFHTKTFKGAEINYNIVRGDLVEFGNIYLSYNRFTNTAQIIVDANFDSPGILFCAKIDGEYLKLVYTSTSTGVISIFKHSTTYFSL